MKLIKAVSGDGHPVHVYNGAERYAGWHEEFLSGESVTFEDTYNDTADVELTGNQNGLQDVSGNLLSNGAAVGAMPTLRKVGAVSDSLVMRTGVKTKRISDWENIITNHGNSVVRRIGYNGVYLTPSPANDITDDFRHIVYKYDSTPLVNVNTNSSSSLSADKTFLDVTGTPLITLGNNDTGWCDALLSSSGEIQAYFYGWKMCNADGSSPYYKSEVPYTPSTWSEWTGKSGVTIVGNRVVVDNNATASSLSIPSAIKPNTKYGFLANIPVNTRTTYSLLNAVDNDGRAFGGGTAFSIPDGFVGNIKAVSMSASVISSNTINAYFPINSGRFEAEKFCIFELPTGSQIESDFTNLTADQLAAKYTFNGLCVKNWKHVTDGLGQTAVLPTASYAGYTPYKMLYQLAVPVEEQYTPVDVPTYLGQTVIETDSVVKPGITATAKVPD